MIRVTSNTEYQAIQFNGSNYDEIASLLTCWIIIMSPGERIKLVALIGTMNIVGGKDVVRRTDWIVTDGKKYVPGRSIPEVHVCNSEEFHEQWGITHIID